MQYICILKNEIKIVSLEKLNYVIDIIVIDRFIVDVVIDEFICGLGSCNCMGQGNNMLDNIYIFIQYDL